MSIKLQLEPWARSTKLPENTQITCATNGIVYVKLPASVDHTGTITAQPQVIAGRFLLPTGAQILSFDIILDHAKWCTGVHGWKPLLESEGTPRVSYSSLKISYEESVKCLREVRDKHGVIPLWSYVVVNTDGQVCVGLPPCVERSELSSGDVLHQAYEVYVGTITPPPPRTVTLSTMELYGGGGSWESNLVNSLLHVSQIK